MVKYSEVVLHTWNQRLHFHPHLHCTVPGAGIDAKGRVVTVKNANFLVPQKALRTVFRARCRDLFAALAKEHCLPAIDPAVWRKDWGVHLQPFGNGENIIKYLGRYVCRSAIGGSRIASVSETHVSFRWKDRANGDAPRVETIPDTEFVGRYLRHVLPCGLRSIRYHDFCHPAAKAKRERIAFHTGRPLLIGALALPPPEPSAVARACPCRGGRMKPIASFHPRWRAGRAPPPAHKPPRRAA